MYRQTAPNDDHRAVVEALARYETTYKPFPTLRLSGAFDARADSHDQTDRRWRLDWQDRSIRRPSFSVRRLSGAFSSGGLTAEAGKQLIRWGKTDIVNPTDRFAPRDYLSVVDNEFLAVLAARLTYERAANTIDLIWVPRFTPSRTPLIDQRWAVVPATTPAVPVVDAGGQYPGRRQLGARWNRVASGYEYSLSIYDGVSHLPSFDGRLRLMPARLEITRVYPQMRMYGVDAALPLRWFTIKGETGYFTSRDREADEYWLYVLQLERQIGEWSLVGGYAGETVTERRSTFLFAPDRGLTRAFVGRAGYTIDANRSIAIETAIRQSGSGVWLKSEYSQAWGQHVRGTAGVTIIGGDRTDFLGQYRRNSHAMLAVRYSF